MKHLSQGALQTLEARRTCAHGRNMMKQCQSHYAQPSALPLGRHVLHTTSYKNADTNNQNHILQNVSISTTQLVLHLENPFIFLKSSEKFCQLSEIHFFFPLYLYFENLVSQELRSIQSGIRKLGSFSKSIWG